MNDEITKEVMPKKKVDYLLRTLVSAIAVGIFMCFALIGSFSLLGETKATIAEFIDLHGADHEFVPMLINMHNIAVGELLFLIGLLLVIIVMVVMIVLIRKNPVNKAKKVKIVRLLAMFNAAVFVNYLVYAIIGLGTINGYLETVGADKLDLTQSYSSFVIDAVLFGYLIYEANRAYKDALSEPIVIEAI